MAADEPGEVHGTVAPGYEGVREEFARVADVDGAQLAAYVGGELVIDLWTAGEMSGDRVSPVFSCTKGAVHLAVAMLVADGLLDVDEPIATYWPEFAAAGKRRVTVRQLLSHQAGLVGVPEGFTASEIADDTVIAERLGRQRPLWEPGTAYGYHALTMGALAGEVVRRVTEAPVGEFLAARVALPPEAHVFIGMRVAAEHLFRAALPATSPPSSRAAAPGTSQRLRAIAFNQTGPEPTDLLAHGNSPAVRRRGPASAGGVANARGLAALYATALTGVDGREPLLDDATTTAFSRLQTPGTDLVTGRTDRYALGFEAAARKYPELGGRAVGHSGASGCEAFADPDLGIAYAYVRTRLAVGGGEAPENHRLVAALAESAHHPRSKGSST